MEPTIDIDEFLEHHGISGMKWGVRKDSAHGVSRTVDRHARKDAAEFARAKAFYGEGAGTRRKLIKQTVEAKTKNIPGYKKAFDHHLNNQDMSKHAAKAVSERNRTDSKNRNKQRAGFVARKLTGEMGTQAAFTAAVIAGGSFLASPKGRSIMSTTAKKVTDVVKTKQNAAKIADFISKGL